MSLHDFLEADPGCGGLLAGAVLAYHDQYLQGQQPEADQVPVAAAVARQGGCCNLRCTDWEGERKLKKCQQCLASRYCSPECQKADWRAGHKRVCTLLAACSSAS